jgi:hypothetical protein
LTTALLLPQKEAVFEKCSRLMKTILKTFDSCLVKEIEPSPEWTFLSDGFILTGRPDLILYNPQIKNYIIVDFKSGAIPTKKDCVNTDDEGIKNFQLPAYHKLAESQGLYPASTGVFISIQETKITRIFDPVDARCVKFEVVDEDFERKAKRYADEISSVIFEQSYSNKYDDCLNCDYRKICRTTFTIQGEKRMGRKGRQHVTI